MKIKGIAVIGAIVIIILIVIILPQNNEQLAPQMGDTITASDQAEVELGMNSSDSPQISDSAKIDSEADFYIDEDGVKHYIIEAKDKPVIGDQ